MVKGESAKSILKMENLQKERRVKAGSAKKHVRTESANTMYLSVDRRTSDQ
jgi:hypothetical protein